MVEIRVVYYASDESLKVENSFLQEVSFQP